MAVGAFTYVNNGILNGAINGDFLNDNHYAVLATSAHTPAGTDDTLADISASECADADYARQDLTGEATAVTASPPQTKLDHAIVSFGTTVTITAKYMYILIGTVAGATSTDKIVGYVDLDTGGGSASSTSSDFTVDAHATDGSALIG